MKILLLGDASNYHSSLAKGLRALGHDVTVASNGSRWMNTARDINLFRSPGKLGGLRLWLRLNTTLRRRLRGYDIVQICNVNFIELRPKRVQRIFKRLQRDNGAIFMTMLGNDTPYLEACTATPSPLRYSEWRLLGKPTPHAIENRDIERAWLAPTLRNHCRFIYERVDGIVAVLPEYYVTTALAFPAERLTYGPIPIDIDNIKYVAPRLDAGGKIKILQACHKGREKEKGAEILRRVIEQIAAEHPDRVEYRWVQNVPYDEFVALLADSHIVVDQLYSFSPATTALLAMAQGKVVVSGAEPEYYDFIGENTLRPIINADPTEPDLRSLRQSLVDIIEHPEKLTRLSLDSRRFVEKHHSATEVARRFEQAWRAKTRQ